MTNDIEKYKNIIELFKQALLFYENKDNYVTNLYINNEIHSYIEIDGGSQAKFALEQYKKLDDLNQKLEKDYESLITDFNENKSQEELINNIEIFKQLGGDNNI